jgi:hypothetical protein
VRARRFFFAAALLVSCAVPELDRDGAIRCGAVDGTGLGLCPSGFECRLERCCPTDSSTSTCPGVATPVVGAPCSTNMCTNTAGASACCAPAPVFPGGYTTTLNCTSNAPCGEFGACVNFPFIGRAACVRRCTYRAGAITPCRAAPSEVGAARSGTYVCIPDPEGRAPNDGVCIPDCTVSPAVCGTTLQCNATTHTCGSCTSNPGMCTGGAVCNRDSGQCGRCALTGPNTCPAGQSCNLLIGRCR